MKSKEQQIWDKMRVRPDYVVISKAYWALESLCKKKEKKLKKKLKPLREVQSALMTKMESIRTGIDVSELVYEITE